MRAIIKATGDTIEVEVSDVFDEKTNSYFYEWKENHALYSKDELNIMEE